MQPLRTRTTYSQRVKDSILPLSVADSLPKAFEEWFFTEQTVDHGEPVETCQLCQHESIRYQFEIQNNFTKNTLWVGSKCILKFNLSVFEGGIRLTGEEARKKLKQLTEQMRLESCIKALGLLVETENNNILANAYTFYLKKKCLTPKFAFVVIWRLRSHNIDYSPSFFKISLKKACYREDLRLMNPSHVQMIWPALSSAQRRQAIEMGHKPPPAT